jgi:hypothetical protein
VDGINVAGALVRITVRLPDGSLHSTVECTTASNGRCWTPWASVQQGQGYLTFTVTEVIADPPVTVPSSPTLRVDRP